MIFNRTDSLVYAKSKNIMCVTGQGQSEGQRLNSAYSSRILLPEFSLSNQFHSTGKYKETAVCADI